MNYKEYFLNISIAFDQLVNTFFKGKPDETMSSRAYRLYVDNNYWYSSLPYYFINYLFFWQNNHCYESYLSEKERNHSPEELK